MMIAFSYYKQFLRQSWNFHIVFCNWFPSMINCSKFKTKYNFDEQLPRDKTPHLDKVFKWHGWSRYVDTVTKSNMCNMREKLKLLNSKGNFSNSWKVRKLPCDLLTQLNFSQIRKNMFSFNSWMESKRFRNLFVRYFWHISIFLYKTDHDKYPSENNILNWLY